MTDIETRPRSTFAIRRIDRLTGRIFTVGTFMTGGEAVFHAFAQQEHLNRTWLYFALAIFIGAQLFNFVNFWFHKAQRYGYLIHAGAYAIVFACWPLQVGSHYSLGEGQTPWLWWAVGSASIAAGMFVPKIWAIGYMLFASISWSVLHASSLGGAESADAYITDGLFATLFPGTLAALVWLLRQAAIRVDQASDEALTQEIERVTREAQTREQSRIDSILYTSVFETLKTAAKAKNGSEYAAAVAASQDSLERIDAAKRPQPEAVSTMLLFETLETIVSKIDPECELTVRGSSLTFLPKEVANALSDAALQALNNSLQHAGPRAKRKIHLRSTKHGVKLVISDDGVGFRPSRVPDQSLGFRFVIIRRVESVGGEVHIESSPSNGTSIILEWEAKA